MQTLFPFTQMLNARMLDNECEANLTPRADVLEGEKEFRIVIDLPGVQNDDLAIDLENQSLTVKAAKNNPVPDGFELRRHERAGQVKFSRTFTLGNAVNGDQIAATLDDGVLSITLPKSESSLMRRIEVK